MEATNWATSSHFEYETLPIQLQYLETVITDPMRNIMQLDGKTFLESIDIVKATHSKMNSKFTRRVSFLDTKKNIFDRLVGIFNSTVQQWETC